MGGAKHIKVLLIGWSASGWKSANSMMDQGLMPHVYSLMRGGVACRLAPVRPPLSPVTWTSVATGKGAHQHGIVGFWDSDPRSGTLFGVDSTTRKTKAIWNMLSERGLWTNVVAWPCSHPAETTAGISISDMYAVSGTWALPLPAGTLYPRDYHDVFSALRLSPAALDTTDVPAAADLLKTADQVASYRDIAQQVTAQTLSIHRAATWLLTNTEWNFTAVYYPGMAYLRHHLKRIQLHQNPSEEISALQRQILGRACSFHDSLLGDLSRLAGPEATVILVSDRGPTFQRLQRPGIQNQLAAVPGRPSGGMFCAMGPGLRVDACLDGASFVDVTPTVLPLFGLPIGRDMDGKVLERAFADPPKTEWITTWENSQHRSRMSAASDVQQVLGALTYLEIPRKNPADVNAIIARNLKHNQAKSLINARKLENAVPLLEDLCRQWPRKRAYQQKLALCYMRLGRFRDAKNILLKMMAALNPSPSAVGRSPAAMPPWALVAMGLILTREEDAEAGLKFLRSAEEARRNSSAFQARLADIYTAMGKFQDAARMVEQSLIANPKNPRAHISKAVLEIRLRNYAAAAESASTAIGLRKSLPMGHFYRGVALTRMKQYTDAVAAFTTALSMAPRMSAAHRWLAVIYDRPNGDPEKARHHRAQAVELAKRRQMTRGKP